MTLQFTTQVRNRGNAPVELRIEPWGDRYPLAAGASVYIRAEAPSAGLLTVDYGPDHITVWGWSGSILEVVGASPSP